MRILVTIKQGRSGDIQARAIRRYDEIGVVLRCKALNGFDCFAGVGLVVIFDDLDHFLAAIDHQAALGVYLIGPKRDVRPLRHRRTTSQTAGFRGNRTNFDHVRLCQCQTRGREACRGGGAQFQGRSSFHQHAYVLPKLSICSMSCAFSDLCCDSHRVSVNSSIAVVPPKRP